MIIAKKKREIRYGKEKEESKKDPQLPDEGEEVDTLVERIESAKAIVSVVNGRLEVSLEGRWTGSLIRAINVAVVKAYKGYKRQL